MLIQRCDLNLQITRRDATSLGRLLDVFGRQGLHLINLGAGSIEILRRHNSAEVRVHSSENAARDPANAFVLIPNSACAEQFPRGPVGPLRRVTE